MKKPNPKEIIKPNPNRDIGDVIAKMRIRLLGPNLEVYSDRLVKQGPELYKGPTHKWEGPVQLEFSLMAKEDVKGVQDYLGKLIGDLPIEKKEKKAKKAKVNLDTPEHIEEFFQSLLKYKPSDQDALIKYLREAGFVFRTAEFLKLFEVADLNLKKTGKYQWMIRAIKIAKNPKADKYDPQLMFGFQLGKKADYVKVYMYKKFKQTLRIPASSEKPINYTKKELLKFPAYMREEERLRFSIEHRKLKQNPDGKQSKFYERWKDDVRTQ